jgi:hypothetical protein
MLKQRLVFIVAAVSIATSCFANTEANFRKSISGICAGFANAFYSKNANWFDQNSTSKLIYVNLKGKKQDRKEVLEGMKRLFSAATSVKAKVTCGAVRFLNGIGSHNNTVVSTVVIAEPNGKLHTMVATATTEDAFKWDGGKWKYFRITELKVPTYVLDGKPFIPGTPPPSK